MPRILLLSTTEPAPNTRYPVDPDATVTPRFVPGLPDGFDSAHDWALADLAVLAAGQGAQEDGFDAVCLPDSGDYGAGALRSVLSVPVVTAGRSAMLYALTLGSRFGIVAPGGCYVRTKKLVHEYALGAQCAGLRRYVDGDDALAAARACLEEDGADVLIAAGADAALAARLASAVPIPVVDPVSLSLKLAESLLGLGLTQSRRAWPEPQVRKPDLIAALMAAGARS